MLLATDRQSRLRSSNDGTIAATIFNGTKCRILLLRSNRTRKIRSFAALEIKASYLRLCRIDTNIVAK
jgi:hypothetical protein